MNRLSIRYLREGGPTVCCIGTGSLKHVVYSALDQVGPPTFDGLTNVKRWQFVFLQTWTG